MSLEYRIGDVFEEMAKIPDKSIDCLITSPPFLALRSYLPADHPDKGKEIGSEPTPAAFIDTLLALSAEWGRVLAPHGSLCVELGDTYAGAGGNGGDQAGTGKLAFKANGGLRPTNPKTPAGNGWPLAKSLTGIPTLYPWSLAYGRNLLTGQPSPAGQWRIRNLIVWARPNPPVGALGDKFRPATSYITVACRGAKRYFDLDAVRGPLSDSPGNKYPRVQTDRDLAAMYDEHGNRLPCQGNARIARRDRPAGSEDSAGAPPLDWHADNHPEDGDWLWKLSTQPYAGSHYATFPMALPKRLIEAMCPLRVCTVCGRPSERIVGDAEYVNFHHGQKASARVEREAQGSGSASKVDGAQTRVAPTLGWSDCGCSQTCQTCDGAGGFSGVIPYKTARWKRPCPDCQETGSIPHTWRTGIVLDPFAGSGTTLEAAQAVGRHAIGIDLDARNADLARSRVGMFLDIVGAA